MNYPAQVWFDALRSLLLAMLATWAGWQCGARLPARLGWRWLVLVAPLVTPALLVGQAYAALAKWLPVTPPVVGAIYSVLLALKFLPLAALARRFYPPPLTAEGRFCAQLAGVPGGFTLRAAGSIPWVVGLVIFLFVFTDFAWASLLSPKSWTVTLFAGHHGGSALTESVARALQPLALCLAAILGLALGWPKLPPRPAGFAKAPKASRGTDAALLGAAILTSFAPVALVLGQALVAPGAFRWRDLFGQEVVLSLAIATAATGGAWLLVTFTSRRSPAGVLAVLFPGLLGAFSLALLLLAVLHTPPLDWFPLRLRARWLRAFDFVTRSPFPLVLGEVLLLTPFAFFLRQALVQREEGASRHLARMAGSRRLLWDFALQPRVVMLALLFTLAYTEFTAAAMLAPPGLTPVFVRLHLLSAHGPSAALSALLLAALLAPAALLALTFAAARFYARRDVR